jgi:hypothetical protein
MDSYYLHTVRTLGMAAKQDEYDTQIVKEVWADDYSNLSEQQSADACEFVYESQGSGAYNKCYQAYLNCGSDASCVTMAQKYAQALAKGYSKDFESFKRKSNILGQTGEVVGGLLTGLFGDRRRDNQNWNQNWQGGGTWNQPPRRQNTGLFVGLGLVALVGIGAAVYFARKKKAES